MAINLTLFTSPELITNSVAAGVIVIAGFIVGHFFSKFIGKIVSKIRPDIVIENTIETTIKYIIYFIAMVFALKRFGLAAEIFILVLAILSGLLVIVVSIHSRDFLLNISGWLAIRKRKIKKGCKLLVSGVSGLVSTLSVFEVCIKNQKGDLIVIPNAYLAEHYFKLVRSRENIKSYKD